MGGCGRVQPQRQVGKQSGCARHKTGGGPTVEALRKEVGARLQRSSMGPFLFFFFFLILNLPSLQPEEEDNEETEAPNTTSGLTRQAQKDCFTFTWH